MCSDKSIAPFRHITQTATRCVVGTRLRFEKNQQYLKSFGFVVVVVEVTKQIVFLRIAVFNVMLFWLVFMSECQHS